MKRSTITQILGLATLVLATVAVSSRGEEASVVIDRAIKAAGGQAKLSQLKDATLKTTVRVQIGKRETGLFGECSVSELDKVLILGEIEGLATRLVLNPQGLWAKFGENVEEARVGAVPPIRKLWFALRSSQMFLPLKDKAVTLSPAWDGQIGDRPAVLVKATHKDYGDWLFYFDKQSGLLAKVESRATLSIDQAERTIECVFTDYKDFDGLKHFSKITITGDLEFREKLNVEITLSELKSDAKLMETLFAKP